MQNVLIYILQVLLIFYNMYPIILSVIPSVNYYYYFILVLFLKLHFFFDILILTILTILSIYLMSVVYLKLVRGVIIITILLFGL